MFDCSRDSNDPLLSQLVGLGVNIVIPPRNGISCGDLVISDRSGAARRSEWASVMGVVPPSESIAGGGFTSLELDVSERLERSLATRVLGRVFAKLGAGAGSLTAALNKTGCKRLSIRLAAPATERLSSLDGLLDHLRTAGARPLPAYEEYGFYVVETVWRARSVEIATYALQDTSIQISAEVADELSAGFGLKARRVGDGRVAFDAELPLIFGIGVRQLIFDGGLITDAAPTRYLKTRGEAEAAADMLTADDPFVELAD